MFDALYFTNPLWFFFIIEPFLLLEASHFSDIG